MGKRGPKPAGKFSSKGATLSARITNETRRRLDEAARARKTSVSQELETRLVRSFETDPSEPETIKHFGSQETYALLRLAAEGAKKVENFTGQKWWRDRFTHDLVTETFKAIFEAWRPRGKATPPASFPNVPALEAWPETKDAVRSDLLRRPLRKIAYPLAAEFIALVQAAPNTKQPALKIYRSIAEYIGPRLTKPVLPLDKGPRLHQRKGARK